MTKSDCLADFVENLFAIESNQTITASTLSAMKIQMFIYERMNLLLNRVQMQLEMLLLGQL